MPIKCSFAWHFAKILGVSAWHFAMMLGVQSLPELGFQDYTKTHVHFSEVCLALGFCQPLHSIALWLCQSLAFHVWHDWTYKHRNIMHAHQEINDTYLAPHRSWGLAGVENTNKLHGIMSFNGG